jgi:phosphoserine phosphatase
MDTYLTATALLDRLADLPPQSWIATDADGTLWAADVAELAWDTLMRERGMRPAAGPPLAKLVEDAGEDSRGDPHEDGARVYDMFMEGKVGDGPILRAMALCFSGYTQQEATAFAARVAREEVAPRVYESTRPLLRGLLERGHRLLVVSGSPTFVVEGAVAMLDLPAPVPVFGVTLAREEGRLAPRLIPPITWNAGKVEAIQPTLGDAPLAVAFGDSDGDRQLLEHTVALRVLVHPRPALLRLAHADPQGPWATLAPQRTEGGDLVVPPTGDLVMGED